MSLILDALNRSRKDTGQIPSLATQHYEDAEEESWNPYQLLLVSALLLALLVIGWLLWDREGEVVVTPAAVSGSQVTVAPSPQLRQPAPVVEDTVPSSGAIALAPAATPVEPAPAVEAPPTARALPTGEGRDKPATRPQSAAAEPGVAALYRQQDPSAPATPAREEQPIDIETLVVKAREELADAKLDEHEAPFIATLSQQTKDGIPTILYQRHDYSGTPAKSTVVLNGKTLKAGGKVAAGVTVDEILPDSVVLSHRGTRFRLRALNSWVNL